MTGLQIFSIELQDYRQYKGTNHIDLEIDSSKHINIIEGQNGSGKSNLLNAVTLCFYDTEEHLQKEKEDGLETYPLVNRKRLEELGESEEAEGYIEIELGSSEPEYIFRREFRTVKSPAGGFSSVTGDLKLQRKVGQDWKPVENPHTHLNEILPTRVREYFLFDGEKLDEFFEEGYPDRVRSAILDVSHTELLNRALDHLDKVQTEIERESNDFEGEAQRLRNELDEKQRQLQQLEEREGELEQEIANAEEEIERIDNRLQDSSDAEVREKQQRRKYLNQRLKEARAELDALKDDTAELLIDAGQIIYNYDALQFTEEQFDDLASKGQLPPKIQDWFIDELLDREECICGADLSSDEQKREHLRALQQEVASVMQENIEGKSEIPRIQEDGCALVEEIIANREDIAATNQEIDEHDRELRDISNELKNYDLPEDVDVSALESQREEIRNRIRDMNTELGRVRGDIETKTEEIAETEKAWKQEAEKQERHRELIQKIDFVNDAIGELEGIKETILDQIRAETQENMEQYFNELIWKDEGYEIELDEEYQVSVLGPRGDNKIGSLSAGEKQLLALSFMSALTEISGFDAAIVIDTPLGRISSRPKKRIAQNIPGYLDNTQITFLMTDEEYTDEVRAYLQDYVANEYVLNYVDEVTQVNPR